MSTACRSELLILGFSVSLHVKFYVSWFLSAVAYPVGAVFEHAQTFLSCRLKSFQPIVLTFSPRLYIVFVSPIPLHFESFVSCFGSV